MKTIIAGSRSIWQDKHVFAAVSASPFNITEVVSGGAKGVDSSGIKWAVRHNIPCIQFLPDWDMFGKRAGIYRNMDMGNYADALIAVWDGKSKGTKHMIEYMQSINKPVYIYTVSM